ncbi:ATP synthase subunit a [Candidatus Hydrogenisulfobacillus filiaventi]|uniref:ATP synthase subunit a n=1 Tax=Candidatus Hydrogenisulfobacillus filiaventi TaxID=2707344 RepID=A0A6F8ZE40_9FIRM|nr:F0F1 ATP synthase subunit A [Bacillota bacterium]CAB1128138.1 ATP synthase subunit a [Candidatus Hydrogenisulfobacillus filiaventi]
MTWHIGPYTVDGSLLIYTWLSMILTFVIVRLLGRKATAGVPSIAQSLLESVFTFIADLGRISFNPDEDPFFYELLVSIFLFLVVANFQGMIPGLHSPTSNLNLTLAMALGVFVLIQWYGVRTHGALGYLRHFLEPYWWLFLINLIEELSKPLTMAFRLFGNILVGELFMAMIAGAGFLAYLLGGFLGAFAWWGFTAFVNVVQAFIFMVLTMAYVGKATGSESEEPGVIEA